MTDKDRLLEYLRANPAWHFAGDLVGAAKIPRGFIYPHLHALEAEGHVEKQEGVTSNSGEALPAYRAKTG